MKQRGALEIEFEQSIRVSYGYPVVFTRAAFEPENPCLHRTLRRGGDGPHRILPVIDAGLLGAWPDLVARLSAYAEAHRELFHLVPETVKLPGGEACKSDPGVIEDLHSQMARHRICRHSFILGIGGGALLDAVGLAAATAHRGVRLIRMPTTVLAQNDAGIGVKNAVNFRGRKNFVGTFAPPFAVLNDFDLLSTLGERDLRSGIAEAVKVALLKDRAFFDLLYGLRRRIGCFEPNPIETLIVRCAELHLEHIRTAGDPFEFGSARPLDFGHWSAHKLEELARGGLRHGEAVAVGIAIDASYAQRMGMIGEGELHRILSVLEDVGFDLRPPVLARLDVDTALSEFQEHLGGERCITLLDGIGSCVEVHEIDVHVMKKCIDCLLNGGPWS